MIVLKNVKYLYLFIYLYVKSILGKTLIGMEESERVYVN